ncbi:MULTISPECIES: hypothetical protein [Arthrobacter]|uniref:Uncharacterized protein n=1 Tax=Arthrobacter terricola TaxID=2547396 RepID=A0A4R5KU23_9MICC|nr:MULTISPECIES: hypothetical protein [Arthrobacter]MBT8160551.1 hypothetical protein [Arthrobacter sp. GN70]TDF98417.1 hypothetical protein E1809_06460 [Arthrobacter terricola]
MFDPKRRHTMREGGRHYVLAGRLQRVFARAAEQAKSASSPFKVGDYVSGDDPFNGSREGVVAVVNGSSIGLRTSAPGGGAVVYYDYRQLRRPW